ncbi:MAG: hypothetical protein D6722_29505, partial [Bacteroidetes bacterium]
MLRAIIPAHLEALQAVVTPDTVLVYQGFPLAFLQEIWPAYPLLGGGAPPFDAEGRLDLQAVEEGAADLLPVILAAPEKPVSMLYETFLALSQAGDLTAASRSWRLIRNPLFDHYPNLS